MKRKIVLLLVILAFLLCSCQTVSPFLNKTPYIEVFGEEGQVVVTAKAGFLGITQNQIQRVNVCFNQDEVCGSIEGNFSKLSGKIISKNTDIDYDVFIPESGIAVFSNKNAKVVADKTVKNRKKVLDSLTCARMLESDLSLYCKNPKEMGFLNIGTEIDIEDKVNYCLLTVNDDKYDLEIVFYDKKQASSAMMLLKLAYISELKTSGKTIDFNSLTNDFILSDETIYIYNREFNGFSYFDLLKGELGL